MSPLLFSSDLVFDFKILRARLSGKIDTHPHGLQTRLLDLPAFPALCRMAFLGGIIGLRPAGLRAASR